MGKYNSRKRKTKKNIPAGEKGNIDLYAKWTPVKYNVQYNKHRKM